MAIRTSAAAVALLLIGSLQALAHSAATPPRTRAQLERWAEGPVRWLLRPGEARELRRITSAAAAVNFVERFWRRRDPEPDKPGNPFREAFFERVEAADLLYPEGGTRGSLSDRGRAMILLGPPQELRLSTRPALTWDPRRRRGKVKVEEMPVEVWVYRLDDLPQVQAQGLTELAQEGRVELVFITGTRRTYLSRGEEVLELAASIALARPH